MTKKTTEKPEEEKVNQPAGAPIAPSEVQASPGREVLSHQWQENSPALNTNELAGYPNQPDSVLESIQTPEKVKAQKVKAQKAEENEKETLSEEEWRYRTKLDVSHPDYINPSLDHHHFKKAR